MASALILAGCGGTVEADLSDALPRVPSPKRSDSYGRYVEAAKSMEQEGARYIGRTSWTPDQRDYLVDAARELIAQISGLTDVRFDQTWANVFGPRPYTRGWRTIGRTLQWRIENALKVGNNADAIYCLVSAGRMSNALATSDSHDADMGLEIVSSCLDSIWPSLPKFGAAELNGLSSSVSKLLVNAPGAGPITIQERKALFVLSSWIRDCYQARKFSDISKRLGQSVGPAVKYLRDLAESPAEEQRAYFTGFAKELDDEVTAFRQRLESAPYEWREEPKRGTRPWMRFTDAFGTPWRVYVEKRADVRTRLRLLAIDAALLARYKSSGTVPTSLVSFSKSLRTDPYSGRDLAYLSRGVDFKLYSVGPDRTDDGGDEGDLGLGR